MGATRSTRSKQRRTGQRSGSQGSQATARGADALLSRSCGSDWQCLFTLARSPTRAKALCLMSGDASWGAGDARSASELGLKPLNPALRSSSQSLQWLAGGGAALSKVELAGAGSGRTACCQPRTWQHCSRASRRAVDAGADADSSASNRSPSASATPDSASRLHTM